MNNKLEKREYCPKHPTHTVNPKYGKCFICRVDDGDLIKCIRCDSKYHDPKYDVCFDCHEKQIEALDKGDSKVL